MKTLIKFCIVLAIAFGSLFTAAACNKSGENVPEKPRNYDEEIMPLPEPPLPRNQPYRIPRHERNNCVPI